MSPKNQASSSFYPPNIYCEKIPILYCYVQKHCFQMNKTVNSALYSTDQ